MVENEVGNPGKKSIVKGSAKAKVEHSMEDLKSKFRQSFSEPSNLEIFEIHQELATFKIKTHFDNQEFRKKPDLKSLERS